MPLVPYMLMRIHYSEKTRNLLNVLNATPRARRETLLAHLYSLFWHQTRAKCFNIHTQPGMEVLHFRGRQVRCFTFCNLKQQKHTFI